jgi:oligopeptide transport system substrate-binding protein
MRFRFAWSAAFLFVSFLVSCKDDSPTVSALPSGMPAASTASIGDLAAPATGGAATGQAPAATSTVAIPAASTFTLRIPGEPETLDWNKAHTPIETYILMNLMEGLVGYDAKLNPVPSLAQKWTVSSDGRTYTFTLRPGVKWSDGVTLRAQDFVYSWKRLLSPVTAAAYAYFLFDIEGAEYFNKGAIQDFKQVGVKALDDLTLQVKLVRPVGHWIHIPTFWVTYPMREDIVEKYGNSWDTPGRMVTLGPYQLASHDYDTRITLKGNPTYWGTRGNVEQIVYQIIAENSTALSLYEAGKMDLLTDISSLDLKRLSGREDLKTFPYLKTGYLGLVVSKYPMSNVHLRRAIAMGIDKSKVGEILLGGQKVATSFVPPGLPGYSAKAGLPFDIAKARAELRASGIDQSKALALEIVLPNWDKQVVLSQFIQQQLKKNLGIEVTLQPFDNKTFRSQVDLRAFPAFLMSWSADFPDPDNFMSLFTASAGNNRTNWKNEKYDDLVLAARNQMEPAARDRAYQAVQKILLEDEAAVVPLYYEPNLALVKARAKGVELNPLNYLLLRNVTLSP